MRTVLFYAPIQLTNIFTTRRLYSTNVNISNNFWNFQTKTAVLYCLQINTPRTWENDTPESDLYTPNKSFSIIHKNDLNRESRASRESLLALTLGPPARS